MQLRSRLKTRYLVVSAVAVATLLGASLVSLHLAPNSAKASPSTAAFCRTHANFCTEPVEPWQADGTYIGHDEPSVLFYSNTAGSGSTNLYHLTLPTQPATLPVQDGSGGTFDFQLHPAFWFGMAMCDDQSAPNPGGSTVLGNAEPNVACAPASDMNIYTSANPADPHFIGRTPGSAFMEMQFYPPGWAPWAAGVSCDATKWCAALNIDSLSENMNTNTLNNPACQADGVEYVNFAFITKSGVAHAPASPVLSTGATFTPNPSTDLFMNSGDNLTVDLRDTSDGLKISINDLTSGESGSMTASAANQFGEEKWDPTGTTCTNIPTNFHPMYATSSENTRVVWAAHSYNVAYSDEIGHFEYCAGVDPKTFTCHGSSQEATGRQDGDDAGCFSPSQSTLVRIGGCIASDDDFDGVPYVTSAWPGNGNDANTPAPITFSSPTFNGSAFSRVAFETDLPRIEDSVDTSACRVHGVGCTNPPVPGSFYPFYEAASVNGGMCMWREGGAGLPHSAFDGVSSANEYGTTPIKLLYPAPTTTGTRFRFNDFRQVLSSNPC